MAKVSISTVVVVGKKEILKSGKLYDESVDMQVVIKSAMDKAAAQAERSLCFVKAEAFASDFAMERRGTELDTDDLSDMTVKHLRDHFGQFLKLHAAYAGVETAGASSLPSASDRLMQAQRYQSRALPAQPTAAPTRKKKKEEEEKKTYLLRNYLAVACVCAVGPCRWWMCGGCRPPGPFVFCFYFLPPTRTL